MVKMVHLSRPVRLISLGCLGVLVTLGLGWYLFLCLVFNTSPFHTNPFDTLTFNQKDWLEDQSCVDGSNRRGHMADDIVRHYLVKGRTEAQIVTLLGQPQNTFSRSYIQHDINAFQKGYTPETYFQSRDLQADRIDSYYLGEEQSMMINTAWLYIYLDQQGHYIGYRIHAP